MNAAPEIDVGRPKKAKAKADADASNRKPLVIQVRASDEWRAWVEGMAERDGRSLASLVDRALIAYGKQIGYEKEPPKR